MAASGAHRYSAMNSTYLVSALAGTIDKDIAGTDFHHRF